MCRRSCSYILAALLLLLPIAPASAQLFPDASGCSLGGADDKCESWVAEYEEPDLVASESPADIVVAPDGRSIYTAARVTVGSGFDGKARWVVLAHDSNGNELWKAYWGEADKHSFPTSIKVSPSGKLVYVSGSSRDDQVAADGHLTTIAFDASDGSIVWTSVYDGPGGGTDNARDLVLSPDGRTLFIAGISAGAGNGDLDYAAIAYDALTGAELWVTRWDGIGRNNSDSPFAIDISSDGGMIYLTGWSYGEAEFNNDYGTIAIATKGPDAGKLVWSARYDGVGVGAPDQASSLVVSPDDQMVFVTGMSNDADEESPFAVNYGYATVAYDASTGEQLWESRKSWGTTFDSPTAMSIDPSGNALVVTGQVGRGELDYGTVAYDPTDGSEIWSDRYGFQGYDLELGKDIAIDPRGGTVYVTGISAKSPPGVPGVVLYAPNADQLTIAYDLSSGSREWLARYNPSTTDHVSVQSLAVSPDASKVYTAASLDDQNWDNDGDDNSLALIAYEIGPGIPVPPPPATLEIAPDHENRGQYSDEAVLSFRLTDPDGSPISGAEITLEFLGRSETTVTDGGGIASFFSLLDSGPGEHGFLATFQGTETQGAAQTEGIFLIEKEDVTVTLEASRTEGALRASLVDGDSGAAIVGREVLFYFQDRVVGNATTDANGVATLADQTAANRPIKHMYAVFEGDSYYNAGRS